MRRADRLFQIIQFLRRRQLTTATQLAERLEVSERTIYRDVKDLMGSGVPIEGEAGVGYVLGRDFDLPPMMFSLEEVQALVLGARMVESFGDASLRTAARSVLNKVEAVLPEDRRAQVANTALFSLPFVLEDGTRERLGWLRQGIDQRRKMRLEYRDQKDQDSERVVRPLGLYFWGRVWTLAAWCELREDYRNFRVDRVRAAEVLAEEFSLVSPCTIEDYVMAMSEEGA